MQASRSQNSDSPLAGLDTRYSIETPEGIDMMAKVAGPVPRILAFSVDLFYRSLILAGLAIGLEFAGKAGAGITLLCAFLLEWFYPVFFEVLKNGQTPGKKAFALAVVNENLTPVTWSNSIMRNLLRFADFLPFGYSAGILCMTYSTHFQRLGDLAAGTIVVYREAQRKIVELPEVAPAAPPKGLQLQDQLAIISLTQRNSELSEARQQELADLLQSLSGKSGRAGLQYLQAVGRWLLGARQGKE